MAQTPPVSNGNQQLPAHQDEPAAKSPVRRIVLIAVAIALVVAGVAYYRHSRLYESTDDAFIEGHIIPISARVSGHVQSVLVQDNQLVRKGDLLVQIDPNDYEVALAQKQAALEGALARQKAGVVGVGVTTTTSGANVAVATSDVASAISAIGAARAAAGAAAAQAQKTEADLRRFRELYQQKVISKGELDAAEAAAKAAADAHKQSQSQIKVAEAQAAQARGKLRAAGVAPEQIKVSEAEAEALAADMAKAKGELQQSQLQLSYTAIRAPESGRVSRKTVEAGAYIQIGQPLLALVPNDVWVVANFKETQLTRVRPGQPVRIRVDAYPDAEFRGHVDSVQRGTGSRFSLLPPENATGNYVKVVQRVPVKIVFDGDPESHYLLAPGMSVDPKVKVQ